MSVIDPDRRFVLRRSCRPYSVFIAIFAAMFLLLLVVSIKLESWSPLKASLTVGLFLAALIFSGTRYKISWSNGAVVQEAFGKVDVMINVNQITDLRRESANTKTLIAFNRPFRRVTIVGQGQIIDVSLRHFVMQDVCKLIRIIESLRPDLRGRIQLQA